MPANGFKSAIWVSTPEILYPLSLIELYCFVLFSLQVEDDNPGYSLDMFCIPKHYQDSIENIIIPYGLIQDR